MTPDEVGHCKNFNAGLNLTVLKFKQNNKSECT